MLIINKKNFRVLGGIVYTGASIMACLVAEKLGYEEQFNRWFQTADLKLRPRFSVRPCGCVGPTAPAGT